MKNFQSDNLQNKTHFWRLLDELVGWLLGEHNEMQIFEQRCGSVGRWWQKQQRGHGVKMALCALEGSSIPEQGEECFSVCCQCRQQDGFFPKNE
jgi:hypothetical protein